MFAPHSGKRKQPPKRGLGFLAAVIRTVQRHAGLLAGLLDAPHLHGGRRGYGSMPKLTAYLLQSVLNVRFAKRFLNELNTSPDLLELCGLKKAPSESRYSAFKKTLAPLEDEIEIITAKVLAEIGPQPERLKADGTVPATAPKLGDYIAFDSTDVKAYGNPDRSVPKDTDATWDVRTRKQGSEDKMEELYGYKCHEAADAY